MHGEIGVSGSPRRVYKIGKSCVLVVVTVISLFRFNYDLALVLYLYIPEDSHCSLLCRSSYNVNQTSHDFVILPKVQVTMKANSDFGKLTGAVRPDDSKLTHEMFCFDCILQLIHEDTGTCPESGHIFMRLSIISPLHSMNQTCHMTSLALGDRAKNA